jgi:hypothetical protein
MANLSKQTFKRFEPVVSDVLAETDMSQANVCIVRLTEVVTIVSWEYRSNMASVIIVRQY